MADPALVPTMSGDSTPSPYVLTSSSVNGTHYKWYAFDNTEASEFWQANTVDAWLQVDLGSPQILTSYNILGFDASTNSPKDWTILGSATGSFGGEETTLDTQTSQATGTEKSYTITTPLRFRYWRIHVTAVNSSTSTIIKAWRLYGIAHLSRFLEVF